MKIRLPQSSWLILTIFVLIYSCKQQSEEPADQFKTISPLGNNPSLDLSGIFKLAMVNGEEVNLKNIYGDPSFPEPFITFDTTTNVASGQTGCNTFVIEFEQDSKEINFSTGIEKTEKACEPGAEWENRLFEIISGSQAQLEDNRLTIRNQVGRLIHER